MRPFCTRRRSPESLKHTIDQLDEILELVELAERQKLADEREIDELRRALRRIQPPRQMQPQALHCDPRRDEPRRDQPRRDEPRRDDQRRNEPRRDEPRRDEPHRGQRDQGHAPQPEAARRPNRSAGSAAAKIPARRNNHFSAP